jgi:hypothetical protein
MKANQQIAILAAAIEAIACRIESERWQIAFNIMTTPDYTKPTTEQAKNLADALHSGANHWGHWSEHLEAAGYTLEDGIWTSQFNDSRWQEKGGWADKI